MFTLLQHVVLLYVVLSCMARRIAKGKPGLYLIGSQARQDRIALHSAVTLPKIGHASHAI
jgi:hypothetical protein